jgi:hypothetical protein
MLAVRGRARFEFRILASIIIALSYTIPQYSGCHIPLLLLLPSGHYVTTWRMDDTAVITNPIIENAPFHDVQSFQLRHGALSSIILLRPRNLCFQRIRTHCTLEQLLLRQLYMQARTNIQ